MQPVASLCVWTGAKPRVRGWAVPLNPYTRPVWGLSKSEMRRLGAELLYELVGAFREDGWTSVFV